MAMATGSILATSLVTCDFHLTAYAAKWSIHSFFGSTFGSVFDEKFSWGEPLEILLGRSPETNLLPKSKGSKQHRQGTTSILFCDATISGCWKEAGCLAQ